MAPKNDNTVAVGKRKSLSASKVPRKSRRIAASKAGVDSIPLTVLPTTQPSSEASQASEASAAPVSSDTAASASAVHNANTSSDDGSALSGGGNSGAEDSDDGDEDYEEYQEDGQGDALKVDDIQEQEDEEEDDEEEAEEDDDEAAPEPRRPRTGSKSSTGRGKSSKGKKSTPRSRPRKKNKGKRKRGADDDDDADEDEYADNTKAFRDGRKDDRVAAKKSSDKENIDKRVTQREAKQLESNLLLALSRGDNYKVCVVVVLFLMFVCPVFVCSAPEYLTYCVVSLGEVAEGEAEVVGPSGQGHRTPGKAHQGSPWWSWKRHPLHHRFQQEHGEYRGKDDEKPHVPPLPLHWWR